MATPSAANVTIYARDMLTAQGVDLAADQRATLVASADRIRSIISAAEGQVCTDKQSLNVPVQDGDHVIGYMTYWL